MNGRRINLLFIVNSLGFGGAEKHLISLVNHLCMSRYRLSLAYLKEEETLLPQIDTTRLEGGIVNCKVACRIDLRVIRELARHLRLHEVDLVVCVNTYSLLYGHLARAVAGSRCMSVELFHSNGLDGLQDRLQMWFYRPFIRMTDMLVYVCHNQRRHWRARMLRARQDTVIHNGIDLNQFSDHFPDAQRAQVRQCHGIASRAYLVGLCAAMRPEKTHGDLLQALARLRTAGLPVHCLLIGDGPQRQEIERQIDALALRALVKVTGFLEDVRPAIAACDAMAIVSRRMETFSIAALEAMAMGKAMIMSDIGGAAEQVVPGQTGYLFPGGDIASLANAVQALADQPHARQLGACARAMVEQRFSLPVMVDAYDRLFTKLIRSRLVGQADVHAA